MKTERDRIWNAFFSGFLLFTWSAFFGSATVLIQLLFNLPPMAYQFIPLGILCCVYAMKPLRKHSIAWMLIPLLVITQFAVINGIAYTKFIQQGAPESFRCIVGAIIGLMMASVALFERRIPFARFKQRENRANR